MLRKIILINILIFSFLGLFAPVQATDTANVESYKAIILDKKIQECTYVASDCLVFEVQFQEGPKNNEKIIIEQNIFDNKDPQNINFGVGDRVFVQEFNYFNESEFIIVGVVREQSLLFLFLFFVAAVFIIGKWQGLGSLIGLASSMVILFGYVAPSILGGQNPFIVTYVGAFLVLLSAILLSHGISYKTIIALVSSMVGVVIISVITLIIFEWAKLTGFGNTEAISIVSQLDSISDMKGILFASIILGGVGVLDDITVNQVSALIQIHKANAKYTWKELFEKAMAVGKDHVASLVNTLFIAYASASLPLIMLLQATNSSLITIINSDQFAEEIVRTLIGSVTLIMVVPISTILAALYIKHYKSKIDKFLEQFKP